MQKFFASVSRKKTTSAHTSITVEVESPLWSMNGNNTVVIDVNRSHHLLIAQYAASSSASNGTYDKFLDISSKINQAYAIMWKYDYLILKGIPYSGPHLNESFEVQRYVVDGERIITIEGDNNDATRTRSHLINPSPLVPESRATYNKVALLEMALLDTKYDSLLILDADAMLYDFSRDIITLLPLDEGALLVAHKTNHSDVPGTGSINVGVTLWNLRNRITPLVLDRWKTMCLRRIQHGKDDDDQAPLQNILKDDINQTQRDRVVYAISKEFAYANGRFVRHFIRPAGSTWANVSSARRLANMEQTSSKVCARYHPICEI